MLTFEILGVGLILANESTHFEGDWNKLYNVLLIVNSVCFVTV